MPKTATQKEQLRKKLREQRNALTREHICQLSANFLEGLRHLPSYRSATVVMLYASFQNEVPTADLIKQVWADGKILVLPYTDADFHLIAYVVENQGQLCTSRLGIEEPNPQLCMQADPLSIDVVFLPGIAFDWKGHRIGFGKGCYDRFLPGLRPTAEKIALAYDMQLVSSIAADPHDIPLDSILTESGWKQCHPTTVPPLTCPVQA